MTISTRGAVWFDRLTEGFVPQRGFCPSVRVADGKLHGETLRAIAVVADPDDKFPRARCGEVGILEGWNLAKAVTEARQADAAAASKRAIVAIIDVPSQAYGRREEGLGIHQALAAAAGAYAQARLAGHPVVGLIVGKAMSGAFLAHGYQANRLIALDDSLVEVHAMGKASAARITLRTVAALEKLAATIPPMAYDVRNYATLGLLADFLQVHNAGAPDPADLELARAAIAKQIAAARTAGPTLVNRLGGKNRQMSSQVRELMRARWQA